MPGLMRAVKLQEKAAKVGFDWDDAAQVIAKVREEVNEIEAEMIARSGSDRLEDELGDVLFAVANLARHVNVDPDAALRRTNAKFRQRFGVIETTLAAEGRSLEDASLDEMEAIWQAAKGRAPTDKAAAE